jgi:hypothetical protein
MLDEGGSRANMAKDSRNGPSNGSVGADLAGLDSEKCRASTHELELTAEERALLRDPEWMDEDEADAIMAMRIEKKEGGSAIPIRQYMRERASGVRNTK